jgi:hypothetical protein
MLHERLFETPSAVVASFVVSLVLLGTARAQKPQPGGPSFMARRAKDGYEFAGVIGKLKEDLTVEVKKILLTSAQK